MAFPPDYICFDRRESLARRARQLGSSDHVLSCSTIARCGRSLVMLGWSIWSENDAPIRDLSVSSMAGHQRSICIRLELRRNITAVCGSDEAKGQSRYWDSKDGGYWSRETRLSYVADSVRNRSEAIRVACIAQARHCNISGSVQRFDVIDDVDMH